MSLEREYRGIIFSKHALERAQDRSITQDLVASVVKSPDKRFDGQKQGTVKFIKTINQRRIHVVASYLHDQKKWLVVSVWVRGEDDKAPIMWQVLTAPFKFSWWIIKHLNRSFFKIHIK